MQNEPLSVLKALPLLWFHIPEGHASPGTPLSRAQEMHTQPHLLGPGQPQQLVSLPRQTGIHQVQC